MAITFGAFTQKDGSFTGVLKTLNANATLSDIDPLLKRYAKPVAGASLGIGAGLVYAPQLPAQ